MQERKLNVLFVTFPYAGTSTGSSLIWPLAEWLIREVHRLKSSDQWKDRIEKVGVHAIADTPITMTRNAAVQHARKVGADVLIMVDSDMVPDVHLVGGVDHTAQPFLDVALQSIFDHYDKGPLVVGAPYCGPPPYENVYVFRWDQKANFGDESMFAIEAYPRAEAQQLAGLHECAALPTGLIAFDMRIFDMLPPPYFFYEWKDEYQSEKGSTEDVASTRNMSLVCLEKLRYNPLLCAWSSWAGHMKTAVVGKPQKFTAENVAQTLKDAWGRPEKSERVFDLSKMIDAEQFPLGGVNRIAAVDGQHPETSDALV